MNRKIEKLTLLIMVLISLNSKAQDVTMRAPAYPLITHNPYFSIWSFSDKLNDDNTRHWTGKKQAMIGLIKVDGTVYQFMGNAEPSYKTILPITDEQSYNVRYTEDKPDSDQWNLLSFNDSDWKTGKAPFSDENKGGTLWKSKDLWVRRSFDLSDIPKEKIFLNIWHDDNIKVYINGILAYEHKGWYNEPQKILLEGKSLKTLRKGKNIMAIHIENTAGGAMLDAGLITELPQQNPIQKAIQTSLKFNATQTLYNFNCGAISLDVTFTSPLLMDNIKLMSRPISYVSFKVHSNDGKSHDVELLNGYSSDLAVDKPSQKVKATKENASNLSILKVGTVSQEILQKKGDDLRIDWGYLYVAARKEDKAKQYISSYTNTVNGFYKKNIQEDIGERNLVLSTVYDLGKVTSQEQERRILVGYDEIYAIQYFGDNLRPYWNESGNESFTNQLLTTDKDYNITIAQCQSVNNKIYNEALRSGNEDYAKLCILSYRQSIAAHELVKSSEGDLLFLSKENFSNGSINTVDITYPSAPLYLLHNVDLLKGMLNGIFHYSETGKWSKPFPAHDLGTYPLANGQTYGEDMPVEEGGNLLILMGAIAHVEKNAMYADKHWKTLTTWAEYLLKNGFDPENQLCTDDFAGHLARNANLSIKAIVALAAYGNLAQQLGKVDIANRYNDSAKAMAKRWEAITLDGDHYKLTFDASNTWSQKYNMVWDKILHYGLFDKDVYSKEIAYYKTKFEKYGLPLDSRKTYTKSDWEIWTATMADKKQDFDAIIDLIYKAFVESPTRVPMTDWYETTDAKQVGFQARSVVGGYFIKILADQ